MSQIVYAATGGSGVYKSTNGGSSWAPVHNGMQGAVVMSLTIDPTNSQIVYAGAYDGIYKTTNGGTSWTSASSGIPKDNFMIYSVLALAIDPADSNTIYAGTNTVLNPDWITYGVYKSTDGGISWTAANNGFPNRNILSLSIDPANSQVVYAGTDNGVYKSINAGASWIWANAKMTGGIVMSLAIDHSASQTIYAGTGEGVFKTVDGGTSWFAANNGISGLCRINALALAPNNSQIVYAGGVCTNAGMSSGLFKSSNAGISWSRDQNGISGLEVNTLVIDPTDSQTVYAGTDKSIYKSLLSNTFPILTGSMFPTFTAAVSGTFQIASSGWPAPVFALTGTLPAGLIFNSNTGVISGTPAANAVGAYPLLITASNGIPPNAVRGFTLTVLPGTNLSTTLTTPSSGGKLVVISGTASGSGLSKAEVQISDGIYYLQTNGTFSATPAWLTATGTTTWSLNTSTVLWREGITYTIQTRASNGSTFSMPTSSTFTIQVPVSKSSSSLSLSLSPDNLRTGGNTTISGLLVKSDTTGLSGQTVTLIITPPSVIAGSNPVSVFKTVTTNSSGTFTTGALSVFSQPGVYMIQARFEGTSTLAASFASQALGVTPQSGYAIIVTGKATDNSLLEMHTASTDSIYSTLVNKRGFLPENITYLKSTIGSPVTRQQLQDAITIWAKNKLVASPAPLYLIMIDHGSTTGFMLDYDTITPAQLKGYLDTLESDPAVVASGVLTAYNRTIMVGTCYSGAFTSLSKPGRVVITSANSDEQSIAGFTIYNSGTNTTYYGGEYFIDALFSYLGRGDSLKDAFSQSSAMVELRDPRKVPAGSHAGVYDTLAQHPLLDDNGDGKPSYVLDADGALAANLQLGVGKRSLGNPADITAVTQTANIPTSQTTDTPLWLQVNDNSRIAKAWMEIRTPITTVITSTTGQVIPRLLTLPLYYDGLQWNGTYNFPNPGTYKILYYTQDNETGDIAPAKNSVVYKQLANNTAPSSFSLTSPIDEGSVDSMFPLSWETVTSANKVTYTLQVATDPNFANVVYREETIPQAATYMPKDSLKDPKTNAYYCINGDSYCYWKVTAIDSYGATSNSNTKSFTIISTNALPAVIKGYVRAAGVPIAGADISLGTTKVNSYANGAYIIMTQAGSSTLNVTAQGYQAYSAAVTATSGSALSRDITLLAIGASTVKYGDCDNDKTVTIAEVQSAVNMFLGLKTVLACVDTSGDKSVSIAEVQKVINSFLGL